MTRIYSEEWDVHRRLQLFGVTRGELLAVVRGVIAARADSTDDDPAAGEGWLAYIYGTRFSRALFGTKGWHRSRDENIESIRHPSKDLSVVYQSVDFACSTEHPPRAISGKGAGADRLIEAAQGRLFSDEEIAKFETAIVPVDSGVWFLCVSVNGDEVCAELSLPTRINGNFENFIERIFVVQPGEWAAAVVKDSTAMEIAEFEPVITRK